MNKNILSGIGMVLGGIVIIIGIIFTGSHQQASIGSIIDGQAYYSTTTSAGFANDYVIRSGSGTFGSVIITTATAGTLTVYDASTTVNGGLYGTTTLAKFGASTAAGTYTFDSSFTKGLIVEQTGGGFASSTITYR